MKITTIAIVFISFLSLAACSEDNSKFRDYSSSLTKAEKLKTATVVQIEPASPYYIVRIQGQDHNSYEMYLSEANFDAKRHQAVDIWIADKGDKNETIFLCKRDSKNCIKVRKA